MWAAVRRRNPEDKHISVERNSIKANIAWVAGITGISVIATWALSNIHIWLPMLFPEPASLPALDATTTVMSFAAQYLMMKRKLENWYLWILVDVIAIWLYWYKEVPFIALLYVVFLFNAIYGWWAWKRAIITDAKDTL